MPRASLAQFFAPGRLAAAHQEIDGDDHCGQCHSAGNRVDNDKCIACHEDVGRTVEQRTGLHGRQYAGKPCGECHVDHRGRDHRLIRWDIDAFEHELTGYELKGEHRRPECRDCHTARNDRNHPTYLGLQTDCRSCHQDKHQGRLGFDCTSCHNETSWRSVSLDGFDHDLARFPLRGKHEAVKCAQCHGEPASYEAMEFSSCGNCHEDPHAGRLGNDCSACHSESGWKELRMDRAAHPGLNIKAGHLKVACAECHDRGNRMAPSRGSACVGCHAPIHDAPFGRRCESCHASVRWLGIPERIGRSSHSKTPFPLAGQHAHVDCQQCHSKALSVDERYRGLRFELCGDCHEDPHRDQFQDRNGGECGPCHTEAGFAPTQFGLVQHASTQFALEGGHTAAPCSGCHTGKAPRLEWQVGNRACADCHDNPHGDQFRAEMQRGGCAECHSPTGWNAPKVDHSSWPLTGAHASAQCEQCHRPSQSEPGIVPAAVAREQMGASDAAAGGALGSSIDYRAAPRECDGCHLDVHLGQFRTSEPVRGCDVCHDTAAFKIVDFDHGRLADYPLIGKHAEAGCLACHTAQALLGSSGQTIGQAVLYRLPYSECRDCHADPHEERP